MFEMDVAMTSAEMMVMLRLLNDRQVELREAIGGSKSDDPLFPYRVNEEQEVTDLLRKMEALYAMGERKTAANYKI